MLDLRSSQVLRVQTEMLETGCTTQEACDRVGISRRSYYRWVAENPQAIELVKEYMGEAHRNLLLSWSQSLSQLVGGLIETALNPATKAETKLKILKFLDGWFDQLTKLYHAQPGGEDQVQFLKQGLTLHLAESRLASLDIATPEADIRVDVHPRKTVDAEFLDNSTE